MPLDAPGPRNDVGSAEAARLHVFDASVRAHLDAVRVDRVAPPRRPTPSRTTSGASMARRIARHEVIRPRVEFLELFHRARSCGKFQPERSARARPGECPFEKPSPTWGEGSLVKSRWGQYPSSP
jgi:hypothetical protein